MSWYDAVLSSAMRCHGLTDIEAFRAAHGLSTSTAVVATYYRGELTPYNIRHGMISVPLDCSGPFYTDTKGVARSIDSYRAIDAGLRDIRLHERVVVSESKDFAGRGVVLVQTARFKWIPLSLTYSMSLDTLTAMVSRQLELIIAAVVRHATTRGLSRPWVIRCPSLGWDRDIHLIHSDDDSFGQVLEVIFASVLANIDPQPTNFCYTPRVSIEDLLSPLERGTLFVVAPCQTWCLPGGIAGGKTIEKQIADNTTLRSDTWWMCNPNAVDFQHMHRV